MPTRVSNIFRKKTDSGSSNGSNKVKEPWPLLNSTRTSTPTTVTNNKEEEHTVIVNSTTHTDTSTTSCVSTTSAVIPSK